MRIACISDTHTYLKVLINQNRLPDADVLTIAGDVTYRGKEGEIRAFNKHLGMIKDKYRRIYLTPGNHDFLFQESPTFARNLVTNAKVLVDEGDEFEGVYFYGSPWQPWFYDWAYNFPPNDNGVTACRVWGQIPDKTNVLITHGPPLNILDRVQRGEHVGCPYLRERVLQLPNLKLHTFGHIHEAHGRTAIGDKTFINAATCTLQYQPTNPVEVFEL